MNIVFLSLGSNLGNRDQNLNRALQLLGEGMCTVTRASAQYETEPWQMDGGNNFLNQVIGIQTILQPLTLLKFIDVTEATIGRLRTGIGYQSRHIDIDILLFNDEVIQTPLLTVPHPHLAVRRFVLEPFCEIAPYAVHPVLKKTVKQLLAECTDTHKVRRFENNAFP